jgi:hypothetical protein
MNQTFSMEGSYEVLDTELDELDPMSQLAAPRRGNGGGSCCRRCAAQAGQMEQDEELAALLPASWVQVLHKLYKAGRLGWRAGRWIDKQTGKRFGKSISQRGAEFLYRHLGRSRRLEDFFDSLPAPVRRWLNQL